MKTVKVQYAKTNLSKLLHAVERGEDIVIARDDQPIARLIPLESTTARETDFVPYDVPVGFFEPLPEDDLVAWEGTG